MERLTTNKSVADMSMIELAHNSCYADDERNARYRDYDMEMDARDFTRNLMATLTKDELPVDDAEFDEEILDNLTINPFSDVRGLIALFHRNMWAMADLREKLKDYEDAEEQGRYIKLPEKVEETEYRECVHTRTKCHHENCKCSECRAAMDKQIVEKELESHDEKHILKYCISLMQELVGKFEEWYEYVHGEDAIRELDEVERFYYRMSYFSIVQELFLFSFGGDEE